jgi:type I restriction enzyme S subunit
VEWFREIPAHWQIKALKHIAFMKSGETISPEQFTEDGFPVFGGNGFRGYTKTFTNEGCFALVGRQGALCGNVNYVKGRFYASEHAIVVYPLNGENYFWLGESIRLADLNRYSQSAAQPGIAVNTIKNILFPYPPISEQIAIAAFLDRKTAQIDQAVAINEKQIALLKERKQILIQNALILGLNPNAPMRDSGMEWIGEIPAHWEMNRVKNIFRLVIEPSEKNNNHELLSIYTDIGVKPRKELEEKGNKASTTDGYWLVKKGDFIVNKLLAWMGAIGLSEYEGVTSPAYDILRPIKPVEGYFYHYFFRTKACSSELKKYSRGIMEMRLRLYFDKFGAVEVPYPPKKEQTAIVAHIEIESAKIDQAINLQQQQIDKLKEYKATLINSAVTGKIKVPELVEGSSAEFTKAPVFEPVEGELVEDGVA